MEKVYRVQKNGVDVENSATNCKNVAFAHAKMIFESYPFSIVTVVSTELVEHVVATYSALNCRLRIGDAFERFTSVDSLLLRISFCIENRINFTLMF